MSAFAELIEAIVFGLVEMTMTLAEAARGALAFIFSKRRRQEKWAQWSKDRARCVFDLAGGGIALVLCAGMVWWWASISTRPVPPPTLEEVKRAKREALTQRLIEEVRVRREKRENTEAP